MLPSMLCGYVAVCCVQILGQSVLPRELLENLADAPANRSVEALVNG
jgi:hypothetical protein